MPATLDPTTIKGSFEVESGVTTINVTYVYISEENLVNAEDVAEETLKIINIVPNKPPSGGDRIRLKNCNVQHTAAKNTFTVSATYDDNQKTQKSGNENNGGKGNENNGGGRGPCLPPDTETVSTVKAMKDIPLKNSCGTPVMPSPQVEVAMLQRTVVQYQMGDDTSAEQLDLKNSIGKIDLAETARQDAKLGIKQRDNKNCPPDEMAPAPGADDDARRKNRPCGSLLNSGNIGPIEFGPCGPYFAVTKVFIDGDFQAQGIFEADYTKCGYGNTLHTGVHNGEVFPIVALKGIGGVIPWPGQPGIKK